MENFVAVVVRGSIGNTSASCRYGSKQKHFYGINKTDVLAKVAKWAAGFGATYKEIR